MLKKARRFILIHPMILLSPTVLERQLFQPGGGLFFQANIINTKGIIIRPVAINTGCMILKSTGTPIARR
jgi:hypothetical protein